MNQECKYKKRLQFYLDGWVNGDETRQIEEHLKYCAACQIELAELAELQDAVSDIVDQAPEREYWDSFVVRVRNRILSRSIPSQETVEKRPSRRFFSLRLAAISTTVLAGFILFLLIFGPAFRPSPPVSTLPGSAPLQIQSSPAPNTGPLAARPVEISDDKSAASGHADRSPADLTSANADGSKALPGKQVIADRLQLPERDITREFRSDQRWDEAVSRLDDSPKFPDFAFSPNGAISDPTLRLKPSVLSEGIISSSNDRGGIAAIYHGPMYNYQSSPKSGANNDLEGELPSSWGYLRVPSDSASNVESKKYLIELELMQTK